MTQQRLQDIHQMLEACKEVDATDWDAEKTAVMGELLAEVANASDCATSDATTRQRV